MPYAIPSNIDLYISDLSWVKSKPKKVPLAFVSCIGVRSPEKYGRNTMPFDPGGDFSAS